MSIKVVYIDDEIDLCEIFSETFESPEINVVTFSDPQKALKEVPALKPDVIFVDFRLPNITGDKIAKQLNLSKPVYLITGDLQVAVDFEFKKILQKPVKSLEIQSILDSLKK
jgi:FixJ family two-component response regulator